MGLHEGPTDKLNTALPSSDRSANPFVRLRRELLVDRHTGSRYLGASMFWRHLEKIPTKHVYRSTSVEFRSIKLMLVESVLVIFVALFLSVELALDYDGRTNQAALSQAKFWANNIANVTDVASMWDWMSSDLLDQIFSSQSAALNSTSYTTPPVNWLSMDSATSQEYVSQNGLFSVGSQIPTFSPFTVGGSPFVENVLLGPVRVRQVSVLPSTDCQYTDICYPSFSDGEESTSKSVLVNTPSSIEPAFVYARENVTQQARIGGDFATYPGDGYMFEILLNRSQAEDQLATLQQWGWIDSSTRAVIVEVSVVNSRTNFVLNSVVLFEFLGTGGVVPDSTHAVLLVPARVVQPAFVMSLATLSAITALTIYIFGIFLKTGFFDFFTFIWNWVDLVIIVLYFYTFSLQFTDFSPPSSLAPVLAPLQTEFTPFSTFIESVRHQRQLVAVITVLAWIRLVKPLALFRAARPAVQVFMRSVTSVGVFLTPFLLILSALMVGFTIAFDSTSPSFQSLRNSFASLWLIYTHSLDVTAVFTADPSSRGLQVVMLILYLVVMLVALPGAVLGVVLQTYRNYKQELVDAVSANKSDRLALFPPGVNVDSFWHRDPISVFFYTWSYALRGVELLTEREEDVGYPEEQWVELDLLPEIIRTKWKEKRDELIEMAQDKFTSRKRTIKREETTFGERMSKLLSYFSRTRSIAFEETRRASSRRLTSISVSAPAAVDDTRMSRVQLQRLLDTDAALVALLKESGEFGEIGETKIRAIDVIRKFSTKEATNTKFLLDSLLGNLNFNRDRTTDSVHRGLGEVVKELETSWKVQLAALVEATTEITQEMLEIKRLIEQKEARSARHAPQR